MTVETQVDERQRHINGFVDAFVTAAKRDRYRTLLLNPKRRRKITDRLNHNIESDLALSFAVPSPPRIKSGLVSYVISDCREIDDTFVVMETAIEMIAVADFGTVISIMPGVLVAIKGEAPSPMQWLYRRAT